MFMGLTVGLLPGIQQHDQRWTISYYSNEKLVSRNTYSQSHNKIFGIIPLFITLLTNNDSDQRPVLTENIINNLLSDIQ
jgi:hypothetical protein